MIVCEACQESLATVHLTEIVQAAKRELHLCEVCAKDRGVLSGGWKPASADVSPDAPTKTFPPVSPQQLAPAGRRRADPEPASCPSCAIGLEEFRSTGRLGCPRDYDHFRAELEPLLERIHGARAHTGRVPTRVQARLARAERLELHQRELQAAIDSENYEEAARLRDLLIELEGSA